MKSALCRFGPLLLAIGFVSCAARAQKAELLVYTALETDQLKGYVESFARHSPDIELKFVRDSNGAITAKVLAEKASPRADVILGVAASSMEIFNTEGLLAPYAPDGVQRLKPAFVEASHPPAWVGQDLFAAVVCYNPAAGREKGIPRPETWRDLAKPVYKGQITMPNPASSGTGFLEVSSWLQLWGEAGGWSYMDALHENIAQYTHSGSKPCLQAGTGEYVVGISLDFRGNEMKQRGALVDLVFPREGLGWDLEASGIVKATRHLAAAKRFMDWIASREANEMYARNSGVVADPAVKPSPPYLPHDLETRLIRNDFAFAAKNRERILAEWQRRYGAKTEK
jgi:iron(III) transport system substrate-binding protein